MFKQLLEIKKHKEHKAQQYVLQCKKHLENTINKLKQAENKLSQYTQWRSNEEKLLYANIINAHIKQKDLNILKQKIGLLREKDILLQQAITEAQNNIKKAEIEFQNAREIRLHASKAVQKMQEINTIIDKKALAKAIKKEEQEIEDIIKNNH